MTYGIIGCSKQPEGAGIASLTLSLSPPPPLPVPPPQQKGKAVENCLNSTSDAQNRTLTTMADGSLTAPRKLTEAETAALRSTLLAQLVEAKTPSETEDAGDLLDYALAMLINGKAVDYIVGEMVGMEMDACDEVTGRKVSKSLVRFLKKLDGGDGGEDGGEEDDAATDAAPASDEHKVGQAKKTSLRVSAFQFIRRLQCSQCTCVAVLRMMYFSPVHTRNFAHTAPAEQ